LYLPVVACRIDMFFTVASISTNDVDDILTAEPIPLLDPVADDEELEDARTLIIDIVSTMDPDFDLPEGIDGTPLPLIADDPRLWTIRSVSMRTQMLLCVRL
jgi:hypothetical protein